MAAKRRMSLTPLPQGECNRHAIAGLGAPLKSFASGGGVNQWSKPLARYILLVPFAGASPSFGGQVYPAGITLADTVENQMGSANNGAFGWLDVVFPELCACPNGANVAPIDAAASAVMMGAALYNANTGRPA
jgi:hypothetical protein